MSRFLHGKGLPGLVVWDCSLGTLRSYQHHDSKILQIIETYWLSSWVIDTFPSFGGRPNIFILPSFVQKLCRLTTSFRAVGFSCRRPMRETSCSLQQSAKRWWRAWRSRWSQGSHLWQSNPIVANSCNVLSDPQISL